MAEKLKKSVKKKANKESFDTWSGAVLIPLDDLVPTEWNANEMSDADLATLMQEIDDGGFDEPLQVVKIGEGENKDKYLILGGEHRYKTALGCGFDKVPCVIKKHLGNVSEADLMLWSVQRNNIRGQLNLQKYMQIQDAVTARLGISREAAQRRMHMREELVKGITEAKQQSGETAVTEELNERTEHGNSLLETDSARERSQELQSRKKLLENLKTVEQDVLLQSGDTVEHGYLFFGQGGKEHLVVEENPTLYALIKEMVGTCKKDSADINFFLISAIRNELKNWD